MASMHIVQLLLPLCDNDGRPFPDDLLISLREELVARFGGVTAFSRSPADGVWAHHGRRMRDEVVLVEVMTEALDQDWWRDFRLRAQKLLRQETIVIRAVEGRGL